MMPGPTVNAVGRDRVVARALLSAAIAAAALG
jgi:hypothetical protein